MAQRLNDADWADLIARRPRDGIYGVVTTGVYCRYGCPSAAPLRRNARAFDTALDAQSAGLRACKRCRPL